MVGCGGVVIIYLINSGRFMKYYKQILFVFLLSGIVFPQIKIGFITSGSELSKQEFIKAKELLTQPEFTVSLFDINKAKSEKDIRKYNIIWIHDIDSTASEKLYTQLFLKLLKKYISGGGKVFLSMEAFPLVVKLGLESTKPEIKYISAVDEGYGRKLGLHAFREHPVFEGMHGGAYIWNPHKDQNVRQYGFFSTTIPAGKVIAVDWSYITLKDSLKILLEYNPGKGKVIAAGSYVYLAQDNYNILNMKMFLRNVLNYLHAPGTAREITYWSYTKKNILPCKDILPSISIPGRVAWEKDDTPALTARFGSDNFFDAAGQRIVLMGKEKGGIDEIWSHPFMALRDYEAGLIFKNKDTVYWLNDQRPEIEVRPGSFTRIYKFRRAFLKEIITSDPENPSAVVRYEYKGLVPVRIITRFKSNFRYMWPYPEEVLGSIYHLWDSASNSYKLRDSTDKFNCFIGFSRKPYQHIEGRLEGFVKADSFFRGRSSSEFIFSALQQFDLSYNDYLDIVISSGQSENNDILNSFTQAMNNPRGVHSRAVSYYRKFQNDKLLITSPDEIFNEGYKWALYGTDKFFVSTPGIGKSLVAGYSTTATGWDGNQKVSGRPGYAWYFGRDGQWSGFALLDYGDFEKVKEIIRTYNNFQDLSGKIYHELTTSGVVHYDAADATPLYVVLTGKYLKHTGDLSFIKEIWPNVKKALDYCYSTDTDGDHLIENTNVGHGWVEGGKLYGTHTTLYLAGCWAACLSEASYIADKLGFPDAAGRYKEEALKVSRIIDDRFWNNKTNFYNEGIYKDGSFLEEPTIQVSVPAYFNVLRKERVFPVLDEYAANGFSADWGTRIVSERSSLFNPRGYHYGSVWPLFTGWTSLAEYKWGKYDQGFTHMMSNLKIYKNFALGYVEEVLNGAEYMHSGVCRHQCWSETMVLQPAIEGVLGFSTDALERRITLSPGFPADWDHCLAENIRSGNNKISMIMRRSGDETIYTFRNEGPDKLQVDFNPAFPKRTVIHSASLDGKQLNYKVQDEIQADVFSASFELGKEAQIKIKHSKGIAVIPLQYSPVEGDSSQGFRLISSFIKDSLFIIKVEGRANNIEYLKIYAPGLEISNIENAEIAGKDREYYILKVKFETGDKYSRRDIRIKL